MVIDKNIDKAIKEVYNILENRNCYLTVIYKDLWLYIKINFKDDKISKIELKSYSQSMKNKDEYDITSINNLFNNIKNILWRNKMAKEKDLLGKRMKEYEHKSRFMLLTKNPL